MGILIFSLAWTKLKEYSFQRHIRNSLLYEFNNKKIQRLFKYLLSNVDPNITVVKIDLGTKSMTTNGFLLFLK